MTDMHPSPTETGARSPRALAKRIAQGMMGTVGLRAGDALLGLAISVVLARLLGPEDFGVIAYTLAIINTLRPIPLLGLPNLIIRLTSVYRVEGKMGLLHGLLRRCDQTVAVMSILTALMVAGFWHLIDGSGDAQKSEVFLLALVALPFITLISLREGQLRSFERVIAGTLPDALVRPGLFLLGSLALFYLTGSTRPEFYILVDTALAILTFVIAHAWYRRSLPIEVTSAPAEMQSRRWLREALPFSAWSMLTVLNLKIDVLMLGLFVGSKEIAFYVIASQIVRSINVICINAINLAVGPYVARFHAEGKLDRLQNLVTWSTWAIFLFSLLPALLLIFMSGPILGYIFGPEYSAAADVSMVLAGALLVRTAVGSVGQTLMMSGHAGIVTIFTASSLGLTTILCLVLIPQLGVLGAAVSVFVSTAAWSLACAAMVCIRVGIRPSIFRLPRFG